MTGQDIAYVSEHAKQLCTVSENIASWNESRYGAVFKFSTVSTLSEVRRIWASYAQTKTAHEDGQVRAAIQSLFDSHFKTEDGHSVVVSHGARSAGAHGLEAMVTMSEAFHQFWKTGVVAGNKDDVSMLRNDNGGRVNPLMSNSSVSSVKFNVHYGADPLLGFHLAEAFDLRQSASKTMDSLASLVKSQFFGWCYSFAQYVVSNSVSVVHHCGESVNFSHALQDVRGSGTLPASAYIYNKPWSATRLSLPSTLATRFNVIDTSNIIDHVGLLNVLPAVVPLLSDQAGSTLYTESLL